MINIKIENTAEKLEDIGIRYENNYKILTASNMRTIVNIVIKRLKQFARLKKWKSIPEAIRSLRVNDNEYLIYPKGEKSDLFKWLHSGTKDHYISPVKAKALHWKQSRKDYFSKGHWVRGIQATNFFRITPDMQEEIRHYLNNLNLKQVFK